MMYTNELFGKEVLDVDANSLGKVADIEFDILKGTISNLIIKTGLVKKMSVSLDKIDKVGDRVLLNARADDLK